VLAFSMPAGVTMAPWDSGRGTVTDAFKDGQIPGASGPLGMGFASAPSADGTPAPPTIVHGGVDSSMGGLY
jgi:hypothetical protein